MFTKNYWQIYDFFGTVILKNRNLFRKTRGAMLIDFSSQVLKREGFGVMFCNSVCSIFLLAWILLVCLKRDKIVQREVRHFAEAID